jgi:hypothetical protein
VILDGFLITRLTNLLKFFSVTIEVLEIIEEDGKYAKKQVEASGFVEEM